ncbi:hypothetical protein ACFL5Z_06720 [Planctomycetota bacterium]
MDENAINKERVIKTLEWMVDTLKHQYDQETDHRPNMGPNQYSPEMTEAIALLDELKKG